MREIANLARIVTLRRLKNEPLLDLNARQLGKEGQLAVLLANDVNATPLQVIKQLYGKNSEANQAALARLRGRMQDKLLNHLFFLDHSDTRLFVSRRYDLECFDLLHKITVLYLEGEYVLSERLTRRCLRLAERCSQRHGDGQRRSTEAGRRNQVQRPRAARNLAHAGWFSLINRISPCPRQRATGPVVTAVRGP